MVEIKSCMNGYIVKWPSGLESVFTSLSTALEEIRYHFEGNKSPTS